MKTMKVMLGFAALLCAGTAKGYVDLFDKVTVSPSSGSNFSMDTTSRIYSWCFLRENWDSMKSATVTYVNKDKGLVGFKFLWGTGQGDIAYGKFTLSCTVNGVQKIFHDHTVTAMGYGDNYEDRLDFEGTGNDTVVWTITKIAQSEWSGGNWARFGKLYRVFPREITFDMQGGSGGQSNVMAYDDEPMPTISVPTKSGLVFAGYFDANGKRYYNSNGASAAIWDKSSSATLYAHWGAPCTATLDAQGGSGGSTSAATGVGATMPKIVPPTKTGYSFIGYFDANGKQYYNTDGIGTADWDKDGDAILTARWDAKEIHLLPAGYKQVEYIEAKTKGRYIDTKITTTRTLQAVMDYIAFEHTGGVNLGASVDDGADWRYFDHGGGALFDCGKARAGKLDGAIALNVRYLVNVGSADDTLYLAVTNVETKAQVKYYTAVCDGNPSANHVYVFGGMRSSGMECTAMRLYSLSLYDFKQSGDQTRSLVADFVPCVNPSGAAGLYDLVTESFYSGSGSGSFGVKYYPQVTVTFDPNGGEGGTASVQMNPSAVLPAITVPTRAYYTFTGYFDAKGKQYYNADGTGVTSWDKTAAVTLYAQWTGNPYTVTLDAQGGTGGTASVAATYGAAMPSVTVPTKTGHAFLGYFDAQEGGTKYYNADGTSAKNWDKAAAATLYAQWTANTYTVTLNPQGGEGGTASVEATCDEPMPSPIVKPTRTGYTFLGYFDQAADGEQWYDARGVSTNVSTFVSAATLYAQWKGNTYKFVLDGGSFVGEQAVVYGQLPADLPRVPVEEGKEFKGYFDEEDRLVYNTEGKYVGSAPYAAAGDTRLTAVWGEKPETVEIVAAKQRWPWNGKVDITYTADALKAERSYVLNVELSVVESGASEPAARSVRVAIPSENGERTVMADFGGVVAEETVDENASIKLRLLLEEREE